MATLWIREFNKVPAIDSGPYVGMPMPYEDGTAIDQTVEFSESAQSAAFSASTRYIGISADEPFHYVMGPNPTATTSAFRIPADTPFFIGVAAGQKIAIVSAG